MFSAPRKFGCDAAFPLSDHIDFPDLLRFAESVQPKRVYTVHGFAREFAATLRSREDRGVGSRNGESMGVAVRIGDLRVPVDASWATPYRQPS